MGIALTYHCRYLLSRDNPHQRFVQGPDKITAADMGPVAAAITSPTAPSATYVQAEAASAKTAIDAIIAAIKNYGITL